MIKQAAAEILRNAEAEVAKLSNKAATARDYDAAELLLGIARNLSATADRLSKPAPEPGMPPMPIEPAQPVEDEDPDAAEDAPVFERDGDDLVKTGQSKTDSKTYEHKAPRHTIDILIKSIQEKTNKKGEFRTNRILPLLGEEGRKLPGYQGYLCLRWLRQLGLVQRVGRQRYQLTPGKDFVSSVETAWHSLHQR
jgi:hypothetical protein